MIQIGSIKIHNTTYSINWAEESDLTKDTNFGFVDYQLNAIAISPKLSSDTRKEIVRHEITHAYIYTYGFCQKESYSEEELANFIEKYGEDIYNDCQRITEFYLERQGGTKEASRDGSKGRIKT